MIRRATLLFVLALVALPSSAVAADIEDMLDDMDEGSFTATGVVMCTWGEDTAAATYEITRNDGISMVHGPDGDLMLSGALSASWSDSGARALELGGWGEWEMSDRYEIVERAVSRLGRPATEATFFEGDSMRVRIVVDDASSVPLLTEVYTTAGALYRMAALVEFSPDAPDMGMPDDMPEHEMLMPSDPSHLLPTETSGYRRVDSYEMSGTTQMFYSDGLFSFSVFETKPGRMPERFDDSTGFIVDGAVYRRIVTPTVVWVHWDAPDRSYVLVGDLPPDHLQSVLDDLPDPGRRNVVVRLWRRLFG